MSRPVLRRNSVCGERRSGLSAGPRRRNGRAIFEAAGCAQVRDESWARRLVVSFPLLDSIVAGAASRRLRSAARPSVCLAAIRAERKRDAQRSVFRTLRILALLRFSRDAAGRRHLFHQIVLGQHREFDMRGRKVVGSGSGLARADELPVGDDALDPACGISETVKLVGRNRNLGPSLARVNRGVAFGNALLRTIILIELDRNLVRGKLAVSLADNRRAIEYTTRSLRRISRLLPVALTGRPAGPIGSGEIRIQPRARRARSNRACCSGHPRRGPRRRGTNSTGAAWRLRRSRG